MIDPDKMTDEAEDPRAEMCAEIARLQREVEELSAGVDYYEEVVRLRAALKDIASGRYSGTMLMSLPPQDPAVNRARAALEGK